MGGGEGRHGESGRSGESHVGGRQGDSPPWEGGKVVGDKGAFTMGGWHGRITNIGGLHGSRIIMGGWHRRRIILGGESPWEGDRMSYPPSLPCIKT